MSITGKDVIGLAQTGSGKTGAFALPILQDLLEKQTKNFALVLSPTRELAIQVWCCLAAWLRTSLRLYRGSCHWAILTLFR